MTKIVKRVAQEILKELPHSFDESGVLVVGEDAWNENLSASVENFRAHGEEGDGGEKGSGAGSDGNKSGSGAGGKSGYSAIEPVPLGRYLRLPQRGKLILYTDNLANFFWGTIKIMYHHDGGALRKTLSKEAMAALAEAVIAKTYYHEVFHYRSDIASILVGSRPERDLEEALAVAFGYHHTNKILAAAKSKVYSKLKELFLEEAFTYSAPGYRDWKNYEKMEVFRNKLVGHILHPNAVRLIKGAGGSTDGWLAGSLYLFITDLSLNMMDETEARWAEMSLVSHP